MSERSKHDDDAPNTRRRTRQESQSARQQDNPLNDDQHVEQSQDAEGRINDSIPRYHASNSLLDLTYLQFLRGHELNIPHPTNPNEPDRLGPSLRRSRSPHDSPEINERTNVRNQTIWQSHQLRRERLILLIDLVRRVASDEGDNLLPSRIDYDEISEATSSNLRETDGPDNEDFHGQ